MRSFKNKLDALDKSKWVVEAGSGADEAFLVNDTTFKARTPNYWFFDQFVFPQEIGHGTKAVVRCGLSVTAVCQANEARINQILRGMRW